MTKQVNRSSSFADTFLLIIAICFAALILASITSLVTGRHKKQQHRSQKTKTPKVPVSKLSEKNTQQIEKTVLKAKGKANADDLVTPVVEDEKAHTYDPGDVLLAFEQEMKNLRN